MNIEAEFNYRKPLKENEAKPAYGLDNDSEEKNTLPVYLKAFKKTVHNARESNFDITMGGFELISHTSSVKDFSISFTEVSSTTFWVSKLLFTISSFEAFELKSS